MTIREEIPRGNTQSGPNASCASPLSICSSDCAPSPVISPYRLVMKNGEKESECFVVWDSILVDGMMNRIG